MNCNRLVVDITSHDEVVKERRLTMEELLIEAGFTWVLSAIKKPEIREKYKAVILKVFKVIWTVYGGDPEFQAVVGK